MSKQETLQAEKREVKGTTASKRLRREGVVPAVIYGADQREYMIKLDSKSFFDMARKHDSANFLVNLEIDGAEEKSKLAIVQDVQRDPLSGNLIHIDFRAVSENTIINAMVPIELTGEPVGVTNGGIVESLLHEIEVFCRPGDLPDAIENDISPLKIEDSLKVGELNLPDGVTVKMGEDVLVALVIKPRVSAAVLAEEEAQAEAAEEKAEGGDSGEKKED